MKNTIKHIAPSVDQQSTKKLLTSVFAYGALFAVWLTVQLHS